MPFSSPETDMRAWHARPVEESVHQVMRGPFMAAHQAFLGVHHGVRAARRGVRAACREVPRARRVRRHSVLRLLLAGLAVAAIVKLVSELQSSRERSRGETFALVVALLLVAWFAWSLKGGRRRRR